MTAAGAAVLLLSQVAGASASRGHRHSFCTGFGIWLSIAPDGTLDAKGDNTGYQLSQGNNSPVSSVVKIKDASLVPLSGIVDVSAGNGHYLAAASDGSVYAWGSTVSGETGNGHHLTDTDPLSDEFTESAVPVKVTPTDYLTGIIAVSAGGSHSLALRADGTVWSWGDDQQEQLGNGTVFPPSDLSISAQPYAGQVMVSSGNPLTGVVAVSAGLSHSLALKGDGTVWFWGSGNFGAGGGPFYELNVAYASQITGLSNVIDIAAGPQVTVILKADGSVWAMGRSGDGELGQPAPGGFTSYSATPLSVKEFISLGVSVDLTRVKTIHANPVGTSFFAVKDDGTVYEWGKGDGSTNRGAEKAMDGAVPLKDIVSAADGVFVAEAKVRYVVTSGGVVRDLVISTSSTQPPTAGTTTVHTGVAWSRPQYSVTHTTFLEDYAVALSHDGTVRQVAIHRSGVLDTGLPYPLPDPYLGAVETIDIDQVIALSGQGNAVFALKSDGTVWGWGESWHGVLGTGHVAGVTPLDEPVQILGAAGAPLDRVVYIYAGYSHCVAVRSDGSVVTWGGSAGRTGSEFLGTVPSYPFETVTGLQNINTASVSPESTMLLAADGRIWGWGRNYGGNLGTGNTTHSAVPVQASAIGPVMKSIVANGNNSSGLGADGKWYVWGNIPRAAFHPIAIQFGISFPPPPCPPHTWPMYPDYSLLSIPAVSSPSSTFVGHVARGMRNITMPYSRGVGVGVAITSGSPGWATNVLDSSIYMGYSGFQVGLSSGGHLIYRGIDGVVGISSFEFPDTAVPGM